MIKVLLTSLAVPSHLWTMVIPTARALAAAGHEVTVATAAPMADEAAAGVPMLPLRHMLTQDQLAADPELAAQAGFGGQGTLADDPDATPASRFGRFMAGVLAERAAAELIERTAPDLVIRESLDFSGLLLAEKLGVPLVTLDNAPLELLTRDPALLPWLNRSRAALGLPVSKDLAVVTDGPWITWIAPGWTPASATPRDSRAYQAPAHVPQDDVNDLIGAKKPLVLAAFGSLLRHTVGVEGSPLARVVEALGALPCTAIVALGDDEALAAWTGPRPANVRLTGFAPQRALLPHCDLFITHAGFGSLRESLTAGVPMLALPLHSEQPANARRLTDLGVALSFDPATASATDIADATRTLLTDSAYRTAARDWQRRITALPDTATMIRDLEALVR